MPKRLHLVLLAAATAFVGFCSGAQAQMRGAGFGGARFASGRGLTGGLTRPRPRGRIYLGDPFLYSDYYPTLPYSIESGPPQIVLVRPPAEEVSQPPMQSLMIELQGDHYVRTGGFESASGSAPISPVPSLQSATRSANQSPRSNAEIATQIRVPTILVYRDGHREDVSGYAIIHSVIYARGDYWQDGYWTKNIQLSALNIPATLKANQDNGVKFILPASPNEVVARP